MSEAGSGKAPRRIDPRVLRSRAAILSAATELFLQDGYTATTMEGIAARAGVSKRTVYNNFADKEVLFREVALSVTGIAAEFASTVSDDLVDHDDLNAALLTIAHRLVLAAIDPPILRVRRLMVSEAHRFPELAAEYYERSPARVIAAIADGFERLHAEGRLNAPNHQRAAEEFAFLVMGPVLDRSMFGALASIPPREALARDAASGVRTFLAAYEPDGAKPATPGDPLPG